MSQLSKKARAIKASEGCAIERRMLVTHTILSLETSQIAEGGREEWETKACKTPLFSVFERHAYACSSCLSGWEAEGNRPTDAGRVGIEVARTLGVPLWLEVDEGSEPDGEGKQSFTLYWFVPTTPGTTTGPDRLERKILGVTGYRRAQCFRAVVGAFEKRNLGRVLRGKPDWWVDDDAESASSARPA